MSSGLAEFQEAAVACIVDRLSDEGPRRFLLADEVGLGKTRVAAGVIKALRKRKRKGFTVVYVCSNSEIAEQNRDKLCPDSEPDAVTRLTLLATRSTEVERRREKGDLQLFSFTPGTSFHFGAATGVERERRLLLYLLLRVWRKRVNRLKWREFFCCGSDMEQWLGRSKFRIVRREFVRTLTEGLQRELKEEWNNHHARLIDPETGRFATKVQRLAEVIDDCVDAFHRDSRNPAARKNRNIIIGELRKCLARVALECLQADLVILDEFQRFSEVLEKSNQRDSVVGRLFAQPGVAALILSATPYKMYTLTHEAEDHHTDFMRTLRFLYKCDGEGPGSQHGGAISKLGENLKRFKERLMGGKWFLETDEELMNLKSQIEKDLKAVMCRTERNWYLEDCRKGVEELGANPEKTLPTVGEVGHYIHLRSFLLKQKIDDWNITDFWKSAPLPLSFMDGHYSLIKRLRDQRATVPAHLLQTGPALSVAATDHLKVRALTEKVLGPANKKFKFLWVRPSFTYYADDFYGDEDPPKFLVFSHWKFVPKAISVLLSEEAERRLGHSRKKRESVPLQFRQKFSFSPFDVCYPSPVLADCVNPADIALAVGGKLTAADLYKRAEESVRRMLKNYGICEGKTRSAPLWRIIARIESKSPHAEKIRKGHREADVMTRDEVSEQYQHYREQYLRWMAERDEELEISPVWLHRLTLISLYSPAVCLLRSMRSAFCDLDDWETNNWSGVLNLGINQLRNYFNKQVVQMVIRSHLCRERSYAARVLDYCGRAHLQAVQDEYAYLLRAALPQGRPQDLPQGFLRQIGRVLGIGAGSPSINELTRGGRIRSRPSPRTAHFAVAFGDEVSVDAIEGGGRTRKTAIREAFNSPFWPFVLTTTSVGQEGLDFHLYCRDIMHWNLPSNPVDLEQREGRINRFDGLSIRRNIAGDYALSAVANITSGPPNVWARLFEMLRTHLAGTQRFKHGLYPHWIYQSAKPDGQMIRRHLAFYSKSRDVIRYRDLKVALSLYRLVFGQPRQQDIIEALLKMFPEANPVEIGKKLAKYTINLSPIPQGYAARSAIREASALVNDPQKLALVVEDVRRLVERESEGVLTPVRHEIQHLLEVAVESGVSRGETHLNKRVQAIGALLYLLNPYDELYDFHDGIGYRDDTALIRRVHASLHLDTVPEQSC